MSSSTTETPSLAAAVRTLATYPFSLMLRVVSLVVSLARAAADTALCCQLSRRSAHEKRSRALFTAAAAKITAVRDVVVAFTRNPLFWCILPPIAVYSLVELAVLAVLARARSVVAWVLRLVGATVRLPLALTPRPVGSLWSLVMETSRAALRSRAARDDVSLSGKHTRAKMAAESGSESPLSRASDDGGHATAAVDEVADAVNGDDGGDGASVASTSRSTTSHAYEVRVEFWFFEQPLRVFAEAASCNRLPADSGCIAGCGSVNVSVKLGRRFFFVRGKLW